MNNPVNKLATVKTLTKAHVDRLHDSAARGRVAAEEAGLTGKDVDYFMAGWTRQALKGATAMLNRIIRIIDEE